MLSTTFETFFLEDFSIYDHCPNPSSKIHLTLLPFPPFSISDRNSSPIFTLHRKRKKKNRYLFSLSLSSLFLEIVTVNKKAQLLNSLLKLHAFAESLTPNRRCPSVFFSLVFTSDFFFFSVIFTDLVAFSCFCFCF